MRGWVMDQGQLNTIAEEIAREGGVLIPGVLTADEVARLREATDRHAANPETDPKHISHVHETLVLRRCRDLDSLYAEMVTHPTLAAVVEAVLGEGAAFNALNVIRSKPGTAISRWHVDDLLEFPLPPEIPRFDPRMRMPVLWLTVQVALSDIETLEHGPTQFVPGSHYSGRMPPTQEDPEFEGRGAQSVLCKAGDIYLTNHQCWHRGAPNTSDRTRYIMQVQYARRWADRRFRGLA
jgi:ectoine hydroxylase-related dioxygenase (phytanoyl-CoA dioxygenase family)